MGHHISDNTFFQRGFGLAAFGGEPFVLLFDPITFGSPAGKKEIDVLVNHWRKKERKDKFCISFFPAGDSQKVKPVFWKVYAWLAPSVKVGTLFCHQVGQIWSY